MFVFCKTLITMQRYGYRAGQIHLNINQHFPFLNQIFSGRQQCCRYEITVLSKHDNSVVSACKYCCLFAYVLFALCDNSIFLILNFFTFVPEFIFNQNRMNPFSSNRECKLFDKIEHFVTDHIEEPISLSDIADLICMYPNSVCRLFKKHKKQKFMDYLAERRIKHACELLQNTQDSIIGVAFECGYNLSAFNRNFKKITNMTPCEYREIYSKPESELPQVIDHILKQLTELSAQYPELQNYAFHFQNTRWIHQ